MKGRLATAKSQAGSHVVRSGTHRRSIWSRMLQDKHLYLMLVPVIGFYFLFKYVPIVGEVIAFKDYRFSDGVFGSAWVDSNIFK